jgi:alpha-L-fucosidase 2
MIRKLLLFYCAIVLPACFTAKAQSNDNTLWYKSPAVNFNEALPVGNGRMGAMVYGRVLDEYLSLNENTLWSGDPDIVWNNPQAINYLPLVRQAALHGEYKKADSLWKFMQGPYTESYMPMADLHIRYKDLRDITGYRRSLNLDSAITSTSFYNNGIYFKRSVFASFPDSVLVIRNEASKENAISFDLNINSKLHYRVQTKNGNEMVLTGKCPKHVEPVYLWKIKDNDAVQYDIDGSKGMNFMVNIKILQEGGTLSSDDTSLHVSGARIVTILITSATGFNGFNTSPVKNGKNVSAIVGVNMNRAAATPYQRLLKNHVQDYQSLYKSVSYQFGANSNIHIPTDDRLRNMADKFDASLLATIAQYGRYILIASSRPGGQPSNLKGLWSEQLRPEYSSNWCLDHDAQMSYYPVETNNLSALHQPFLQLIKELAENGKQTARINYNMKGWCAHHNTDIWRKSSPVGNWGDGNPHWANWNMSEAWLSEHFFEHYQFTLDSAFLRQQAYPIMKGAAQFLLDWLMPDSSGKYLVSVPSVSPENTFITNEGDTAQASVNSTSDIELTKDLFHNVMAAACILHIRDAFTDSIQNALQRLKPYPIGMHGNLLEWANDWKPTDPAHRHLSHMYAVFPGSEISPLTDAGLAEAAKKALTLRARTNGTWGFAWKAACWARLYEADSAMQTLRYQLHYVDPQSKSALNNLGLYPNLFNSEVPGVILNGNTCITAVITEMLLQSHTGIIDILPALPADLPEGNVKGLVARGGFIVNIAWLNHQLKEASLQAKHTVSCKVRLKDGENVFLKEKLMPMDNEGNNIFSFQAEAGQTYVIR